eukprot:s507_g9.t1
MKGLGMHLYSTGANPVLGWCDDVLDLQDRRSCVLRQLQEQLQMPIRRGPDQFFSQWLYETHLTFAKYRVNVDRVFDVNFESYVPLFPIKVRMFGDTILRVSWPVWEHLFFEVFQGNFEKKVGTSGNIAASVARCRLEHNACIPDCEEPEGSNRPRGPLDMTGPRQMLSRLAGRCWQIHGYPGGRSLVSFLSRGISVPPNWPRRPKKLFSVLPTKENLEIVDKMHRGRIKLIKDTSPCLWGRLQGERLGDSEDLLSQQLVNEMPHPLAEKYPYLYLYEWAVQYDGEAGEGDLVFASGDGHFAIVEVKYIDLLTKGKTVARRRKRMRKKVVSQALYYANLFRLAAEEAGVQVKSVLAFTYTFEGGLKYHDVYDYDTVEKFLREEHLEE